MSFWRSFGFHPISHIETILDRDVITLEELLDEQELLQECKLQNQRLIDFLIKPEQLSLMFDYVTRDPSDDPEQRRKDNDNYPYIASEILCMDINPLIDAVYKDEKYLSQLFSILDQPSINLTLAFYISKVATSFLARKPYETMAFLKKQENIVEKFIVNLDKSALVEILLKILSIEEVPGGAGTIEWLDHSNLISGIVAKFDPTLDSDFHENASFVLSEILSPHFVGWQLPAKLAEEEVVNKLYSYILADVPMGTSFLNGLTVIIKMLSRFIGVHSIDTVIKQDNTEIEFADLPLSLVGTPFKESVTHMGELKALLNQPSDVSFTTTTGTLSPPLGFYRLKIIEFFANLIYLRYICIDEEIIKLDLLSSCLDLFFQYPWNNLLHSHVSQICHFVLESGRDELKTSLFKDAKLIDRILKVHEQMEQGIKNGFMGFLNHISRAIKELSERDPIIKQYADETARWAQYVEGPLQNALMQESGPLGDFNDQTIMMQPEAEDDDDDQMYEKDYDNTAYNETHISYEDDEEYTDGELAAQLRNQEDELWEDMERRQQYQQQFLQQFQQQQHDLAGVEDDDQEHHHEEEHQHIEPQSTSAPSSTTPEENPDTNTSNNSSSTEEASPQPPSTTTSDQ